MHTWCLLPFHLTRDSTIIYFPLHSPPQLYLSCHQEHAVMSVVWRQYNTNANIIPTLLKHHTSTQQHYTHVRWKINKHPHFIIISIYLSLQYTAAYLSWGGGLGADVCLLPFYLSRTLNSKASHFTSYLVWTSSYDVHPKTLSRLKPVFLKMCRQPSLMGKIIYDKVIEAEFHITFVCIIFSVTWLVSKIDLS